MRRFVMIGAAVVLAAVVGAAQAQDDFWREYCEDWGEVAHFTMFMRQEGLPKWEVLSIVDGALDEKGSPASERNMAHIIAERAFDVPIAKTERQALAVAADFSNHYYSGCMETVRRRAAE